MKKNKNTYVKFLSKFLLRVLSTVCLNVEDRKVLRMMIRYGHP